MHGLYYNFVVPLPSNTDIMKAIFSTVMLQIIYSRSYFLSTIILVFVILAVQCQPLNSDNVTTIHIDSTLFFLMHIIMWFSPCNFMLFLLFVLLGDLLQDVNHITYNELRSATDNFHSSNKIGRGGFGDVYKVVRKFQMVLVITFCQIN
jgi:hypothetical protein